MFFLPRKAHVAFATSVSIHWELSKIKLTSRSCGLQTKLPKGSESQQRNELLMFARDVLKYKPLPLPHRHNLNDTEMLAAAEAFYDTMRRRHTVRDFFDSPVLVEL